MRRFLCVFLSIVTIIQPVAAWSECGHHIVAVLAFDLLPVDGQAELMRILTHHPRFQEDFSTPAAIEGDAARAHWIVGNAGYWPDIARSQPDFNRPTWHYQLGSSLTIGQSVNVPGTPGVLPSAATLQTQELYIAQAIALCENVLSSATSSDADKALAICWLAHLVGDAHQPCHAGSLYVEGVFPDGDRGANSIPTRQQRNLHALWDGLLGNRYDSGDIRRRSIEIRENSTLWTKAREAAVTPDGLRSEVWLKESSELARIHVYAPEVLNAVEAARRSGLTEVERVDLSEAYLKQAGTLAQERAAFAAHRLSGLLSQCIGVTPNR